MKNIKTAQTISYFIAFVALGLAMASLSPTLTALADQTRVNLGKISYLFTARSFGFLLGSLFIGRFYDRMNGHVVMAATIIAMAAMLALMPVFPESRSFAGCDGRAGHGRRRARRRRKCAARLGSSKPRPALHERPALLLRRRRPDLPAHR